jgi:hypothetical protein
MHTQSSKSCGWALILVALGLLALFAGPRALALLIAAALVVWFAVAETYREPAKVDSRGNNTKVRS